ncbi:MAG: FtsK/SpoIIIE domain-containing protein, partial [Solirubrobacteraceae bacterium]
LGESASFLFGLGDAAETIIGSKVRTTDRELADLLNDLEEHITFVTQKYLQGSFESLTDYNVAAGEVAEPYRALVLYDYPKGFIRADGHVDREALSRLAKIVGAGRRCGVFTFVVSPPGATAGDEVWAPVNELPILLNGVRPNSDWFTHLLLGEATGPVASRVGPETTLREQPFHTAFEGQFAPLPGGNFADTVAAGRTQPLFARRYEVDWVFWGDTPAAESTTASILAAVKRGLVQADGVKVDADQVARIARTQMDRDVQDGVRTHEILPVPSDPTTWWHGSTADGVLSSFGRVGASDVATLPLDNAVPGVVIGGRPGSGKSVLIHALIASWVTRYSPAELQMYLVDFKEGVEFKSYATGELPHAAVVAIESDREFGVSVLRKLVDEIGRRGSLFKSGTGDDIGIAQYRKGAGEPLPRIVCVIDEFHVLFERDDRTATEAGELMEKVVRLGRAFGVHLVLASQTLSGTSGLGRHTLGLLPGRIALQSSDADSRLLLADDNADARLLNRPGEGILNLRGGVNEANRRFQASFIDVDDRATLVKRLRERADADGFTERPVVFEGSVAVTVDALPEEVWSLDPTKTIRLPLGLPLTLDGPVVAELRREPGGHLLIVAEEDAAADTLAVVCGTLVRNGIGVDIVDYGPPDDALATDFERFAGGDGVSLSRRRGATAVLTAVRDEIASRHETSDFRAPARVLVLSALHRARDFEIGEEAQLLDEILREGADVGVHVIVWVDKNVSLGRRLSSSAAREFGVRLVGPMSRDDAFALTESDAPSSLTGAQLVLDDHERATTVRLRRILRPAPDWAAAEPTGAA